MFLKKKIGLKDLYNFCYLMERYQAFGVSEIKTIGKYMNSIKNPGLIKIMEALQRDLKNGTAIPDAMSKHPSFFTPFTVAMARVGLNTGQMGAAWKSVADSLEQELMIKKDLETAMLIQKIFLGFLAAATMLILFVFIPKIGEVLKDMNVELPLITRITIGIGDITTSFWWLFLILGALLVTGYFYFKRQYPEKYDQAKLRIPIFSPLEYNKMQYQFARVFGICRQAGIESRTALQYAAMASSNRLMQSTLQRASTYMTSGGMAIDAACQKADIFKIIHPDFYLMFELGKSGNIAQVMIDEAEKYQKQLKRLSTTVSDKVGLFIMIPGYIVMIFLFASMELPIMSFMSTMEQGGM